MTTLCNPELLNEAQRLGHHQTQRQTLDRALQDYVDRCKHRAATGGIESEPLPKKNGLKALLASWTPLEEAFPEIEDYPPVNEDIF